MSDVAYIAHCGLPTPGKVSYLRLHFVSTPEAEYRAYEESALRSPSTVGQS